MNRASRYFPLDTVVEVRQPGSPVWETMAAFNVVDASKAYARNCERTHPHNEYRVMRRGRRGVWLPV